MFLNSLRIIKGKTIVRDITFKMGLNLIIDDTFTVQTGNGVGKTTVLKIIDFCLGGDRKKIYSDTEKKGNINTVVQDYLVDNGVIFELVLVDSLLDKKQKTITIQRNIISRGKKVVRRINGVSYSSDTKFCESLSKELFPNLPERPTMNQLIAHNIRYEDNRIANAVDYISHISPSDHETLFLYLLGLSSKHALRREEIRKLILQEQKFITRLLQGKTVNDLEVIRNAVLANLEKAERALNAIEAPEAFKEKINEFDVVSAELGKLQEMINLTSIRSSLIKERINDLQSKSTKDISEIEAVYNESKVILGTNLHKKFETLVEFYNCIIDSQLDVLKTQSKDFEKQMMVFSSQRDALQQRRRHLYDLIQTKDYSTEYRSRLEQLNKHYEEKGSIEKQFEDYHESTRLIHELHSEEEKLSEQLYTTDFRASLDKKLEDFNSNYYSKFSNSLYGEKYYLSYDLEKSGKDSQQRTYQFKSISVAYSSGEKQGEVLSFDLATTAFAMDNNIEVLPFLLNDKKELLSSEQINKALPIIQNHGIQIVFSVLKEKKHTIANSDNYVILKITDDDKLFRIESNKFDSMLNGA